MTVWAGAMFISLFWSDDDGDSLQERDINTKQLRPWCKNPPINIKSARPLMSLIGLRVLQFLSYWLLVT